MLKFNIFIKWRIVIKKGFYILALFIVLLISGCATKNKPTPSIETEHTENNTTKYAEDTDSFEDEFSDTQAKEPLDPLSSYNRAMTTFNDTIFVYALNPLSKAYNASTPDIMRESISNFMHNLLFPIRFTNNLLQGKFQNASDELERFIVNSTVGIAGLFDPAGTYMSIYPHNEDFGQTLGYYGIGSGFHIVLPFLGPSNVRDSLGLVADGYLSPLIYQSSLARYKLPKNYFQSIAIVGFDIVNKNASHLGAYESLKKDAVDLYPYLRDFYETKRQTDIEE